MKNKSFTPLKNKSMKNIYKLYLLSFCLLSDFMVFAQPGDESNDPLTPLEGGDPAPAPINSKLFILLVLGVAFAFYKIRQNQKVA